MFLFKFLPKSIWFYLFLVMSVFAGYKQIEYVKLNTNYIILQRDFEAYKQKMLSAALDQQLDNNELRKEHEITTERTVSKYESKIRNIRDLASIRVCNETDSSSSSRVSGDSTSTERIYSQSEVSELLREYAIETQRLISFHEWFNGVREEHNKKIKERS